jgi:hypothetical protein
MSLIGDASVAVGKVSPFFAGGLEKVDGILGDQILL